MHTSETESGPADHAVIDLVSRRRSDRGSRHAGGAPSLDEIVASLRKAKARLDTVGIPGDEYGVQTTLVTTIREWHSRLSVTYNGREITDDIQLIGESFRRTRATQVNNANALWGLFLKEAAEIHLEKCDAILGRLATEAGPHRTDKKKMVVLLLIVLVSGGVGFLGHYFLRPSVKPVTPLADPSDHPPPSASVSSALEPPSASEPLAADSPVQSPPESSPTAPRRSSALSPGEIRVRVNRILNHQSDSP